MTTEKTAGFLTETTDDLIEGALDKVSGGTPTTTKTTTSTTVKREYFKITITDILIAG
jgi:hypothetical protein